jgi:hypothetical protein
MIAGQLDTYWDLLVETGFDQPLKRPGPDRSEVLEALSKAGYGTRDEVVDFFTWADWGDQQVDLWDYPGTPYSLDEAISRGLWNRDFWAEPDLGGEQGMLCMADEDQRDPTIDWRSWLPICDGANGCDELLIDTSPHPVHGGTLWFSYKEGLDRVLDSLADGIEVSRYCVQAGVWRVNEYGINYPYEPT